MNSAQEADSGVGSESAMMVCMSGKSKFEARNTAGSASGIDAELAWEGVVSRDSSGGLFYAVTTTGVFCRPDCKSRRPLRGNVQFFPSSAAARSAGFRPCKRCKPETQPKMACWTRFGGILKLIWIAGWG